MAGRAKKGSGTTMRVRVSGVDFSFDPLTLEEAKCLINDHEVELFVQCLWTGAVTPPATIENIRTVLRAGGRVAGYVSLNGFQDGHYHARQARGNIPPDLWNKLEWIAVDVELANITVRHVQQARNDLLNWNDRRVPIYTSYNAWVNLVSPGNSSALADAGAELWNAFWDKDKDVDFPRLRFGGWKDEQVLGEQYSGDTPVCGQHVDRNIFFEDLALPVEEELPVVEYATKSSVKALRNDVRKLFAATWSRQIELEDRVNGLVCQVSELQAAVERHFGTHNSSGGVIERGPAFQAVLRASKLGFEAKRLRDKSLDDLNARRQIVDLEAFLPIRDEEENNEATK